MKYLLDTHALLWFLSNAPQLPATIRDTIEKEDCAVSIASFWEMSIKIALGKLQLASTLEQITEELNTQNIDILPISINAIAYLQQLEWHHRDPFDRLLIAEAITQNYTLLSADRHFVAYTPTLNLQW